MYWSADKRPNSCDTSRSITASNETPTNSIVWLCSPSRYAEAQWPAVRITILDGSLLSRLPEQRVSDTYSSVVLSAGCGKRNPDRLAVLRNIHPVLVSGSVQSCLP